MDYSFSRPDQKPPLGEAGHRRREAHGRVIMFQSRVDPRGGVLRRQLPGRHVLAGTAVNA